MTQFGQDFQAVIKKNLPNFVIAFFYRVVGYLKQNAYSQIELNVNEIEAQKQNLGENYDKYVVPFILNTMANISFGLEKYKDAIKILDKALMWQKKMLGEKHPLLGDTLNNLAVVYAQQAKYEDVKVLAEQALEIYVQSICDDYPFVAEKLGGLARYFNNQGKYDEEEQCYIRALGICRAEQSSDDSLVAAASNELAQCYLRRGKLRKAKKLFKNVLSKACEKEFCDAGDKSPRLNRLAPKKIFKTSKADNESFTNIWQIAEERERNKTKVSKEVTSPVWYKPVSFYSPSFEFALNGLEAIYRMHGKHVAAKTLNHYANQRLVAPQLPPKRLAMSSPPPALPPRGNGPAPVVSRENIPTMQSSPPLQLPSTQQLPLDIETGSSYETASQGCMVLPSVPDSEEDGYFIETEAVQESTRFLEQMVAKLQAEITDKAQRLAEAERALESHGAFCCICLDKVANRMWSGCNHLVACGECAEHLLREEENRSDDGIACPKCRTHGHVLPVFI